MTATSAVEQDEDRERPEGAPSIRHLRAFTPQGWGYKSVLIIVLLLCVRQETPSDKHNSQTYSERVTPPGKCNHSLLLLIFRMNFDQVRPCFPGGCQYHPGIFQEVAST